MSLHSNHLQPSRLPTSSPTAATNLNPPPSTASPSTVGRRKPWLLGSFSARIALRGQLRQLTGRAAPRQVEYAVIPTELDESADVHGDDLSEAAQQCRFRRLAGGGGGAGGSGWMRLWSLWLMRGGR